MGFMEDNLSPICPHDKSCHLPQSRYVWFTTGNSVESGFPMPKSIDQYNVFIGSPGGLEDERKKFRDRLHKCTAHHGKPKGIQFEPIGWEDTVGGVGRPQEQINEDLKQCDYAVFVLHDRWGSRTGNADKVGTEEEWELAEALYKQAKVRNIALFFKAVDPGKLKDPGEQLKPVLAFKARIEAEKRHLFVQYETIGEFSDQLDACLAKWLHSIENPTSAGLVLVDVGQLAADTPFAGFEIWINEARKASRGEKPDYAAAAFCAGKALDISASNLNWAEAKSIWGHSCFHQDRFDDALLASEAIAAKLALSTAVAERALHAKALFNKGVTLGALGRAADENDAYDEVIIRFGNATEPDLRDRVAKALLNKGLTLGNMDRNVDAIEVYDEVDERYRAASELALREIVAKALLNKGVRLGVLGRRLDAIAMYDVVFERYKDASELRLRERVAESLFNKGITLCALNHGADAIGVYNEVVERYGTAPDISLRELVAEALYNTGVTLGALGRTADAIAAYNSIITRYAMAVEPVLREAVSLALEQKIKLEEPKKHMRKVKSKGQYVPILRIHCIAPRAF
jgi:tetratricopeptide (TPR) repeat protein